MPPYKAVLFDVDGTVQDTAEYIYQAIEHVLSAHGFPARSRDDMHGLIGLPLTQVYEALTHTTDVTALKAAHETFQLDSSDLVRNFPDIENALKMLKAAHVLIGAVSSRRTDSLIRTLTHTGVIQYFDTVVGPYDTPYRKPHAAPALLALERLGVLSGDAIFIGDSHIDIETGKNAGTGTMRVTWGFHTEKLEEPAPDYIVKTIDEMLEILL